MKPPPAAGPAPPLSGDSVGDSKTRHEVLAGAREMLREGLVVGTVGKVSMRVGDRVLITPSRSPYLCMKLEDPVRCGLIGPVFGPAVLSTELPLYLAVFRRRPDVGTVIHTHRPNATAWSFLGGPLLPVTEENHYYGIGTVRTAAPVPLARPSWPAVDETLGEASGMLLRGHGVLASGASVDAAFDVARVFERQAKLARLLRGARGRHRREAG